MCFHKSFEACPQAQACRHDQGGLEGFDPACMLGIEVDRSLYVYKSKRGERAELKLKIRDICQMRVRYGYRVSLR